MARRYNTVLAKHVKRQSGRPQDIIPQGIQYGSKFVSVNSELFDTVRNERCRVMKILSGGMALINAYTGGLYKVNIPQALFFNRLEFIS